MVRVNRFGFLAIAVIFHLIYIYSIFDIYFVSPIVHGMRAYRVERPEKVDAPAKRLVLFVGDGLRADKAFQSFPDPSPADPTDPEALTPRPLAPFLRSRVLSHGTFGVSHTRVPTESRPGHVALIAGLYEDVSAVMTGWKLNPVNFDSVFNRSRHTWSWGSPDILPMFKEGAIAGRVDADVYAEEAEDFTQDATHLDTWVFDKVKDFFTAAVSNSTLNTALREDQLVFFLHLLGLDTTGHAYRPYSKEYLNNIKVVDEGVREITELIEDFYGDQRTAYVFTADHGMSDWGSHGDGHPDNTRTPLIAWGDGVAKPVISPDDSRALGHEDGFSSDWGFDHIQRNDVSQADIAALMAYLVGLEFPVNSVGELPLNYLAGDANEKAEAVLVNTKEILEMYRVKEEVKRSTKLRYQPFAPLDKKISSIDDRLSGIRNLIDDGQPDLAIQSGLELMQLGLDGLRYLQRYDWFFLRTLVAAGYLGWIAFALVTVVDLHVLGGSTGVQRSTPVVVFFSSVLIALYSSLWMQRAPWTYYAYALFPVVFWEEVVVRRNVLVACQRALFGHIRGMGGYLSLGVKVLVFIGLLEIFAQGYFHREVYSLCYVLMGLWPAVYGFDFIRLNSGLMAIWAAACFSMASFTFLPVVKVENVNLILLGGSVMCLVGLLYLLFENRLTGRLKVSMQDDTKTGLARVVLGVQTGLITLAMLVTRSSIASLQAKQGLPLGTQVVGWLVFIFSLTIPLLYTLQSNNDYFHRLIVLFLTFSPLFVILTISYEGLFYVAFCVTLATWVRLEHCIYQHTPSSQHGSTIHPTKEHSSSNGSTTLPGKSEITTNVDSDPADTPTTTTPPPTILHPKHNNNYRPLNLSDTRTALFFLFFIQSAFFSTGNIASVSSFSLDSVYRLIPVFNPFSQGALLIIKILVPFIILSANLGILNKRLNVAPSALFMFVMAVSDIMTLTFFFQVRDEGSWLDIGTSISHFVIASTLCIFVAVLEVGSGLLVRGLSFEDEDEDVRSLLKGKKERGSEMEDERMVNGGKGVNGIR
ncbi:MAG: Glycosyl phosphatidyl inositol anchor synthesis [Watsoniomyces obsoletus]|nr:MAG: Glycosyl phosphatidyl inositol anchor synthesis [Watsoniomyces obsoletus]